MKIDYDLDYAKLRGSESNILGYGLSRRVGQAVQVIEALLATRPGRQVGLADFGCCDGTMLRAVASSFPGVVEESVGVDIFPFGVPDDDASMRISFRSVDLYRDFPYPFPDASKDVILASAFFKHHPAPLRFLAECHRILRPGGHLVLLDPRPWVVACGALLGHFNRRYTPNVWSRRTLKSLLASSHPEERWQLGRYEHYWIAPSHRLHALGVEKLIPGWIGSAIALHQCAVLEKEVPRAA